MDARRFDLLARGFARLGTRRTLMRSLVVAAGGTLGTATAVRGVAATGAVGGDDAPGVCPPCPAGRPIRRVTGVAPFPAFIIGGLCGDLDESVRYNLIDVGAEAPDGDPAGAPSALGVFESMTSIRVPFDDLLADPHAVVIRAGADDDGVIACGDIGGTIRDDALALGLRERNGSGFAGIARLTAINSQTNVEIFLTRDLFDTEQSWEGVTVVTTIDVNLRDQASDESGVIMVLAEGTELLVTGEPTGIWLPVEVIDSGETGYVSAEFVEAR